MNEEKTTQATAETEEKKVVAKKKSAEKVAEKIESPAEESAVEEAAVEEAMEAPEQEEVAVSEDAVEIPEAEEFSTAEEETPEAAEAFAAAEAAEAPVKKAPTKAALKREEMAEETAEAAETAALQVTNEDFDWTSFESDATLYGDGRESVAEQYNKTLSNVQVGEVVEGIVIGVNKREVVVNIGYKSEGIIPLGEFRYNPELAVGEKVEVYVESAEDKRGQLLLSHKMARQLRSWDRVNEAMEKDEIIKGYIKCRTKGGMIVDVFGIEAFLPGSQIDVKPIRDYDIYVDKTMEFKVVKINQEYRNVVVSHKALIEAELEQQKIEIMSKLEKGQILEGTVKNITTYGVFIDLGGVDGLIHITDLSWGRVTHPEEVVHLDQKLNVVILDFDDQKKRIALGLKQLAAHPWDALDAGLKVGDTVKGKVVVMADYGGFVEIAPGVEGLIHVSEMSWSQHLRSAQEFMKVGDELDAMILTLDREERKMSLGIKQLTPDPWEDIDAKYPIQSQHQAKVRNFTNFGVFVELAEGIDGLIHISDLSWTKKIKHPAEFTQIGSEIDVIVLEIDKDNRRLSLGHKQLEDNPWNEFEKQYAPDTQHEGTITELNDKGAVVSLSEDVEGFVPSRQLAKEDGSMPKVGDKLDLKVIEFSKGTRRILLSHARMHDDTRRATEKSERTERKAKEEGTITSVKKLNASMEKTTLGDISGLAELKAQMLEEASEAKPKAKRVAKKKVEAGAEVEEKAEEKVEEKAEAKVEVEEKAKAKAKTKKKEEAPKSEE